MRNIQMWTYDRPPITRGDNLRVKLDLYLLRIESKSTKSILWATLSVFSITYTLWDLIF